jgi:hypothetical protein
MPRGDKFDARFDQSVRNFEIGGAEQTETSACTEVSKVFCQN